MVTITDYPNDDQLLDELEQTGDVDDQDFATQLGALRRLHDYNIRAVDTAFGKLAAEVAQLKKRPPKPRRTGSAARVNPDQLGYGYAIAGMNGLFILGAFALVYAGQYAFAPYTQLPEPLWLLIPIALDLPVVSASFTAAIFIKRKQPKYAQANWAVVFGLTVLGSVIQVTHVLVGAGWFAGQALTFPDLLVATILGMFPWLVMYLSHNLARLLVRPVGETIEASDKTPAPKRRPATKRKSTR
jgi:hypothetical protein